MNPECSDSDVMVLQTMWKLKALGGRVVSVRDLAGHLSGMPTTEAAERLERLQALMLVTKTKSASGDLVALSSLGAAFVRQLQDKHLGDLTNGS